LPLGGVSLLPFHPRSGERGWGGRGLGGKRARQSLCDTVELPEATAPHVSACCLATGIAPPLALDPSAIRCVSPHAPVLRRAQRPRRNHPA
jgi:hypothetical protein